MCVFVCIRPMYAPSYAPPRAYEMNAPASPVMNGLPPFSPATAPSYAPVTQSYPIQYAQHPVQYGPPMGAPRGGAMAPGELSKNTDIYIFSCSPVYLLAIFSRSTSRLCANARPTSRLCADAICWRTPHEWWRTPHAIWRPHETELRPGWPSHGPSHGWPSHPWLLIRLILVFRRVNKQSQWNRTKKLKRYTSSDIFGHV